MTNARGGVNALKWLGMLVCVAIICLCVWSMLPDWIARPNAEATPSQYQDAADAPKQPDGQTYYSDRGKCPALTMSIAKALSDGKLTAWEAHSLRREVQAMTAEANSNSSKNEALKAVGQHPTETAIDCPFGTYLFR